METNLHLCSSLLTRVTSGLLTYRAVSSAFVMMTRYRSIDDRKRFLGSGLFRFLNPAEIVLAPRSEIFWSDSGKIVHGGMQRRLEMVAISHLPFSTQLPCPILRRPMIGCQLLEIESGPWHLDVRRC